MEPEGNKFGRGARELTGAVDLISRYKLLPFQEFFCKKPLPVSIADTHYLHTVVGDAEIRKGDGMLLGQLIESASHNRDGKARIQPIELHTLAEAFHLREAAPVELPPGEKGAPTVAGKSKNEVVDKDKKHKKHKDKHREHKKHRHQHKDQSIDKDIKKDNSAHQVFGADHTKKQIEKVFPLKVCGWAGLSATYASVTIYHYGSPEIELLRKNHDGDQDGNNMHRQKRVSIRAPHR